MTKTYEFVVVLSPELSEQQVQVSQDSFITLVKKHKGKVVNSEVWGKRPLAYKINKLTEANYLFFTLELDSEQVINFDRDVRLNPQVLRYLLVIQEEHYTRAKDAVAAPLPELDVEE